MRYEVTLIETIERTTTLEVEAKSQAEAQREAERRFHAGEVKSDWINQAHLHLRSVAEPLP